MMQCRFRALEVAIALAELVGPWLVALKSKNKDLADQGKRATQSVALNLAEGSRSLGGNRGRAFGVASGSLEELVATLRIAVAFGELEEAMVTRAEPLVDELRRLLWGLTHPGERSTT